MNRYFTSKNKKRFLLSIILMVCIGLIGACVSREIEKNIETTSRIHNDIHIGYDPVEPIYKCDAEALADINIDYTPFVDIDVKFGEQSFLEECKIIYSSYAEQEDNALYGSEGFYVSLTPVYAYNLNDEKLARVMICYVFTADKLNAGEISFNLNEGEVLTIFSSAQANSVDRIMSAMKESPDKKYIKIFNNRTHTIIDEDSKPLDISFKMAGDVFHTLNYEFLGVSYNDIIENLVWIQFD